MPERGDAKTIYGKPFCKYNGRHWIKTYDPFFEPKKTDINISDVIIELFGHEPYRKDSGSIYGLPDLLWIDRGKVAVVVEIVNDSNYGNDTSYEVQKIIEQNKTIRMIEGCENIVIYTICINPDTYDGGYVETKERVNKVVSLLHSILYKTETDEEDEEDEEDYFDDDGEFLKKPMRAITTPYKSDGEDDSDDDVEDDNNDKKNTDQVLFCYYHTKSWNHIDAHRLEFVCGEIPMHEYYEYDQRIYARYYFEQRIERRRKYDEISDKRPVVIMKSYNEYDMTDENQKKEYNRKYNWKRLGVTGNIDEIHDKWINATHCDVCGIRLGGNSSEQKCMDHDHDTGEFRNILCMSCNNHDRWKEVLFKKSLQSFLEL